MARRRNVARQVAVLGLLVLSAPFPILRAQGEERPEVVRALELENDGKFREAAALFRAAVRAAPTPGSVLGLERVYAELGMSDSLLAPLDSIIGAFPREPLYRTVQMRTLQILRREDKLREAFERWVRVDPRDASPYREYARMLIALGRPATADSVVTRGRNALGSLKDLEYENAQLRAAVGKWVLSAQSWRRALGDAPYLAAAASHALAPAPMPVRDSIRTAFASFPAEPGARQALAGLELTWGRPREAWDALRVLRADTAAATIWEEFGERASSEERWTIAREALVAAYEARPTPELATRAAGAALKAGVPQDVFAIAPLSEWKTDSASAATKFVPLHVAALVALGRASDAEALTRKYERFFPPIQRMRLAQAIANGWVRAGDIVKAREALRSAGPDADSSEAAGWLALYEGRLDLARVLLRTTTSATPDQIMALGLMARTRASSAPALGEAFLALARGDSAGASRGFVDAAVQQVEIAPALLLAAARMQAGHPERAVPLWQRVVTDFPGAPEAAESELEWARMLRRSGDTAAATAHLEHLILSAPRSALLPQARRELDQLRGSVPP